MNKEVKLVANIHSMVCFGSLKDEFTEEMEILTLKNRGKLSDLMYKDEIVCVQEVYGFVDRPGVYESGYMQGRLVELGTDKYSILFTILVSSVENGETEIMEDDIKERNDGFNTAKDVINKPNHYIGIHGLEVEEVLQNFIPRYENSYAGHRVASAIEYLLRAPLKNKLEDIEKAKQNLEQILNYEKEQPHE